MSHPGPAGVSMCMRTEWDVIVVGGGLAGLTAAATASQPGARVRGTGGPRPGGRARTVEREGFTLNMGAHALYVAGPGSKVLGSLGITPEGAPPPLRRYRAADRRDPARPADRARVRCSGPARSGARSKAQLAGLLVRVPRIKRGHAWPARRWPSGWRRAGSVPMPKPCSGR